MPRTSSRTRGAPLFLPRDQWPNIEHLVTEDGAPVDGIFSERQMRLLVEALYTSWSPGKGRPFLALANVGLFFSPDEDPLVPDVLLSLDVTWRADLKGKESNSYFTWVYGKCPDVVVEVVSNRKDGEATRKLKAYAKLGIPYYIVYDPADYLHKGPLQVYCLQGHVYSREDVQWLPEVGLGLRIWHGTYEGFEDDWLRWCDKDGKLIPTGDELANQARQQAAKEKQRADRLAKKLRQLGIDPDQ